MDNENCDSHNMMQDSLNNNDIQHHVVTEENQPIIENNQNKINSDTLVKILKCVIDIIVGIFKCIINSKKQNKEE